MAGIVPRSRSLAQVIFTDRQRRLARTRASRNHTPAWS
jgi:hypothetical protein